MTTGHDVARKAVRLWQQVHPGESLDGQCQRYAGYYCLWAGFGHERGITGYGSAKEAYQASKIESKDPMKAPPGAMHYFDIGKYGHIGFALGSGLMAHTSALGDTIETLGSHVKISTVTSYPHKYLGWSRANGTKPSLVGKIDDASKKPLEPNQRRTKNYVVAGRAYANLRDDAIALLIPPNTLLNVKEWKTGDTTHKEKRFLLTSYQGKPVYVHLGDVLPQNVEGIPPFPVTGEPEPTPTPEPAPEPTPEPEPEPTEPTPEPEETDVDEPIDTPDQPEPPTSYPAPGKDDEQKAVEIINGLVSGQYDVAGWVHARVRTVIPLIVGPVISWLVTMLPAVAEFLDAQFVGWREVVFGAASVAFGYGYWALAGWLGKRWPAVEKFMLGSSKKPVYLDPKK